MCFLANIPQNREVKKLEHVKNVITSVIFRQCERFSKENIYKAVEEHIKFSSFGKYGKRRKEINLKKMVDNTLNILWTHGSISFFLRRKNMSCQ